jgi:hypothetical protein
MKTTESLKEIERRAYRSTFEDGIYDIVFGILFLILAWIPVLESAGIPRSYGYVLLLILIPIPWLGKKFITIPRLGAVEFGEKRKSRRQYGVLIGIGAIILILPLLIIMFAQGFPGGLTWRTTGIIAAPLVAIVVYLMDYPRMYIYAAGLLFCILESEMLLGYVGAPLNFFISFAIPGVAILIFGLKLLLSFVKKYPKPAQEASHVAR